MADKSFSFKIGADTSDFIKQMKKADTQIKSTEKNAQELEKGLEIKYDETKFVAAQKQMQQALVMTEQKAQAIKDELKYLEEHGGVDSTSYQKLQTELVKTENKAQLLNNQLKELNNIKLTNLANGLTSVGSALTKVGTAATAVSAVAASALVGLGKLTKDVISEGDEIATLASKYGTTAEEIQKLQYVAMQSDVENTTLYKGLKKLNITLADLSEGIVSDATKSLQELGLDSSASFEQTVLALSKMEDVTKRNYYANQIFGDNIATELIPLFNQGEKAISGYVEEFEEVGYLSDETVSKLSEFDNVLNKLKTQFKEIALQVGDSLIPLAQKMANYISENVVPVVQKWAEKFESLNDSTKEVVIKILAFTAAAGPLLLAMGKITTSVGSLIGLIPQIGSALTALEAHPIIAIIGVIAIVLTVLYTRSEELRDAINNMVSTLGKSLQPVMEMLSNELNNILNLLGPILDLMASDLAKTINQTVTMLKPLLEIITKILEVAMELNKYLNPISWFWGEDSSAIDTATTNTQKAASAIGYEYPTVDTDYGTTNNDYGTTTTNNDNSVVTNNITIEANEYTTAEEVAKVLAIKLQSRS